MVSGSHWWWMRGASTASCTVMSWSTALMTAFSTMVMMRAPPGLPITIASLPSRVMMVGAMLLSGVLPGATALASPCIRPNMLGTPGLPVKSSISLFITIPVPGTTLRTPNQSLSV